MDKVSGAVFAVVFFLMLAEIVLEVIVQCAVHCFEVMSIADIDWIKRDFDLVWRNQSLNGLFNICRGLLLKSLSSPLGLEYKVIFVYVDAYTF